MDRAPESLDPEELLAHAGWVRALAVALVGESKADDLTQATMLRALERPPRHQSNVRAWLGTVARNFAISWSRKDKRQRELLGKRVYEDRRDRDSAAESGVMPETPDQLLGKSEAASQVMQALQDLPDPGRHLLMLRYVEGLTPAEIAARHDMKAVTVRVQLSRALEELRRLMRRRFGGDGMAPCRALLAPLPAPWVVPAAPAGPAWGPILATGGILTATLAGVYLWDASGSPPADPPSGVTANQVRPDESERDSASARLASEGGDSDASRRAAAAPFALRVTDAEGGPIEGARLRLHRAGVAQGWGATDAQGLLRRDDPLGAGVLQLSALDHTPELRAGDWGLGRHDWVLPERELVSGRVSGLSQDAPLPGTLALIGDEPLWREGAPEFELFDEIDPRYVSFQRFLVTVRDSGEFRFAGLPAGWSGFLTSGDPRFRLDDAGLDDEADGRLRIVAPRNELRLRFVEVPRIAGRILPPPGQSPELLEGALVALQLPEGVLQLALDRSGCFEVLRDPRELSGLEIAVLAPRGAAGHFSFGSLPADGDLGSLSLESRPAQAFRVVDAAGYPLAGARLRLAVDRGWGDAALLPEVFSDEDGRAALTIPDESEGVLISAPGYAPQRLARPAADSASGAETEVVLQPTNALRLQLAGPEGPLPLGAADNLEVRLVDEDGLFSGDAALDQDFAPQRGAVLAKVVRERGIVALRLRPDAQAHLELENLRVGRALRVEVRTRTGLLLTEQTLAPLPAATASSRTLRLPRAPRRYLGQVLAFDGRSIAEARVALTRAAAGEEEAGFLRVQTDLQGRFVFPALWADAVDLRVAAPGMALFRDADRQIPLPGEADQVWLEPGREFLVRVVDDAGQALRPAQVAVRDTEGRLVRTAVVEASGAVRVTGLGRTPLEFELFVDGWTYRLTADPEQASLRVELPPRAEFPAPEEGWAAAPDLEAPPHLLLRRPGESRVHAILLRPHPTADGRWTLPGPVWLPRGEWELQTPDGRSQTRSY